MVRWETGHLFTIGMIRTHFFSHPKRVPLPLWSLPFKNKLYATENFVYTTFILNLNNIKKLFDTLFNTLLKT